MGNNRPSHGSLPCRLRVACAGGWLALCLLSCGCNLTNWLHNGCKVGPNYSTPPAAVADTWIDRNDPRVQTSPPLHPEWWLVFGDPRLNDLMWTAYSQNLTVREAGLRIAEARAQRAIAAGNLFPQRQQAFGLYQHFQVSRNVANPENVRFFDDWATGFNASWELDIWGKFRRALESADANLDASVANYDAVLVSLFAEVALAYTEIRTFEARLRFARQNVEIQQGSLKLSQIRFKEGRTDESSVDLAKANLETTAANIPVLESGLRQAANGLCTLLGIPPTNLQEQIGAGQIPNTPPQVALGIPADLLRRRPDVRRAERRIAAQSAQIGVAESDLYPSLVINGQIFVEAENFSSLFSPGSVAGNFGPSVSWNILNYGRILSNVRVQDARFQQLVANYQQTVLTANQEVENALVAFLKAQQQVQALERAARAQRRALKTALIRYREGKIDFTAVFVVQGTLANLEDQLAAAQGSVVANLIGVYRALGGGWEIRCRGGADGQGR